MISRRHFLFATTQAVAIYFARLKYKEFNNSDLPILPPIDPTQLNNIKLTTPLNILNSYIFRPIIVQQHTFYVLCEKSRSPASHRSCMLQSTIRIHLTARAFHFRSRMLRGSSRSKTIGDTPINCTLNNMVGADALSNWSRVRSVSAGKVPGIWLEPRNILAIALQITHDSINKNGIVTTLSTALQIDKEFIALLISYSNKMYSERVVKCRSISIPNDHLKNLQKIISLSLLEELPISKFVFSFGIKSAIRKCAQKHEQMRFVVKLDIASFFKSVCKDNIIGLFVDNGLEYKRAIELANLLTRDGSLPEGSPSSPILASALLLKLDERIGNWSERMSVNYTRYVDDIVVSGNVANHVKKVQMRLQRELRSCYGLHLNDAKTKFMPYWGAQEMLGCCVNHRARPTRKWRRELRSQVHNWFMNGCNPQEWTTICGKLSYWRHYDPQQVDRLLRRYEQKPSTMLENV